MNKLPGTLWAMETAPTSPSRLTQAARLLTVAMVLLLVHSAWRVGPTFDEHFYISSGFSYLQEGDFSLNREHPPLLKALMALPLWIGWKLGLLDLTWPTHGSALLSYPTSFFFILNGAHQQLNLFLARLPMIALTTWMVIVLARRARRQLGPAAELCAVLLVGFNPNVLAHGHIAALDGGVMALMFIATLAFVEMQEKATAGESSGKATLWAAVAFGLANLAKSTALLLGPITLVMAVVAAMRARNLRPLGLMLLVWFGGLGVFSFGYGFEAKSVNQAWGERHYIASEGASQAMADGDQVLATLRGDLSRTLQSDNESGASALYAQLKRFVGTDQELRKRAVGLAVYDPGSRLSDVRMDVMETLTQRSFGTLDEWRDWYAAARTEDWNVTLFTQPMIKALTAPFGTTLPIPLFSALKGLDYQLAHAHEGHTTTYMGKPMFSPRDFANGNPYPEYYAHIMSIKNPLGFLVLFAMGLVLLWRQKWSAVQIAGFVFFPALLFYVFSTSNMLMGARYVLPVFPFLGFIGAAVAAHFPRFALGVAGLSAVMVTWHHPHELMYYNSIGGGNDLRTGGPSISPISDDWGQGVRAMGRFVEAHRDQLDALGGLHYVPMTPAGPMAFGLWGVSGDKGPGEGIYAVHALNYWRDSNDPETKARLYAWLDDYEPFMVIDDSIYLFDTRKGATGENPFE